MAKKKSIKNQEDKKEVILSKGEQQTLEYLKLPMTVHQHCLISAMLYAITGSNRFDQLGDVIYASLKEISVSRIRPLYSYIDAAGMRKLHKMTGATCGTSISGKGLEKFELYCEYLGSIFGNDFVVNSLDLVELIISILLAYIFFHEDKRSAFAPMDVYPSMTVIYPDDLDNIRLCILDLDEGTFDDSEVYSIEEFSLSLLNRSALDIQRSKTTFVTDARHKLSRHENEFANFALLRLRAECNERAKTDKSIRLRWFVRSLGSDEDSTNINHVLIPNTGIEKGSK